MFVIGRSRKRIGNIDYLKTLLHLQVTGGCLSYESGETAHRFGWGELVGHAFPDHTHAHNGATVSVQRMVVTLQEWLTLER